MSKTIEFLTVEHDGAQCVVDQKYLDTIALRLGAKSMTEEEVEETYGERAKRRTLTLRTNSYRLKSDIARLSQVDDDEVGKKHDPELTQAARVAATVESWNLDDVDGNPASISVEGFQSLPLHIATYVDGRVFAYLAPEIASDPDFFAAWQRKLPPIEAK